MKRISGFSGLLLASLLLTTEIGWATNYTISSNTSTGPGQTLGTGDTFTVNSSVTYTMTGSTSAVSPTGTSSITNNGSIKNTNSSGRDIRDTTGGFTLTVTNGSSATGGSAALMQSTGNDAFQISAAGSGSTSTTNVSLDNFGTVQSLKGRAINWTVTSGTNSLTNEATGLLLSSGDDSVRPGLSGVVNNTGKIFSAESGTSTGSDGIDARNNSGIQVTNTYGGSTGTGLIEGARHGITGQALNSTVTYTMSVTNKTGATIQGDNGSGINIDGFNANETVVIQNDGTITGNGSALQGTETSHDGDGVDVDGLVNLTNTGTIKSINAIGDTSEGVTVGGGTIVNSGTIEGDVASGNTSSATGKGITLAGVDKDVNGNSIPVQGIYANTTVTNSGLIKGQSNSAISMPGAASGFTVQITNQAGGVIEGGGTTAVALQTGADNDTVINSGTIEADSSGLAIDLGAGTNSLTISGGSAVITGGVSGGTGTSSLKFSPGAGNSFSYAGAFSNFQSAEVQNGTVVLSGTNTYTGATTIDTSAKLTVSGSIATSATTVNGGELHLASGTAGAVTLNTGGSLTGNGTVGTLAVNSGGVVSPGSNVGVVNAGATAFSSSGVFVFQMDNDGSTGTAGTQWDKLAITGKLDLSNLSPTLTFRIQLQTLDSSDAANPLLAFNPHSDHSWANFITTTNGFIGTFDPTDFSFYTSGFQNSTAGGTFFLLQDGNNLDLEFGAAPEPGTWAMLVVGLGVLLVVQWRQRKNA